MLRRGLRGLEYQGGGERYLNVEVTAGLCRQCQAGVEEQVCLEVAACCPFGLEGSLGEEFLALIFHEGQNTDLMSLIGQSLPHSWRPSLFQVPYFPAHRLCFCLRAGVPVVQPAASISPNLRLPIA